MSAILNVTFILVLILVWF